MPEPGELAPLLSAKGDRARLDRMATLLRLAEDLERSRDQSVREARLRVNGRSAELTLVSDDDTAVPRWAARREVDLFQRAFGRTLAV
jgi:exopolyphosphatase/guanosine-5'-triphosphate,3'-diphosphate pyrophosphatase